MLMAKNVNNNVSKDSPIPAYPFLSMSSDPDNEYPNVLMPGDILEPLMTLIAKKNDMTMDR